MGKQQMPSAVFWACVLIAFAALKLCHAQGEVSVLTTVFPSWDRVIEQLRQSSTQQTVSVAAAAAPRQPEQPGAASVSAVSRDGSLVNITDDSTAEQQGEVEQEPPLVDDAGRSGAGVAAASGGTAVAAAQGGSTQAALGEGQPAAAAAVEAGRTAVDDSHQHGDAPASAGPLAPAAVLPAGRPGQPTPAPAAQQQGQQQQQQQQQQLSKLPKGAFPLKPSALVSIASLSVMPINPISSSVGSQSITPTLPRHKEGAKASSRLEAVASSSTAVSAGAAAGSDAAAPVDASLQAFTGLPSLTGLFGGGQPAQQAAGDSSKSTPQKQQGPQVHLLLPARFPWQSSQPQQQEQQDEVEQAAGHSPTTKGSKKGSSATALPVPTAEESRRAAEADQELANHKILPREPLHDSPPPSSSSGTQVDPGKPLLRIPNSFMGISHEWNHVADINAAPGYKAAIKLLSSYGTGPFIIRVGGGSSDNTKELLPQNVYKALRAVHKETGARFILGLNFEDVDEQLTRGQMQRAKRSLPDDAVVTFELGNEPNFYASKKNLTALEYSRCCFTTEWTEFARNLSCPCGTDQCCTDSLFAGPVWGHINVYPSTFKWFLDNAANHVSLVTVHWYKAPKETPNTPVSLLDEGPIQVEMDNLRQLVVVANSFGKPLRVAEMNTISNSGLLGVSNVFAAALWTLDGAFEVAAAGAVGINLHQGAGQNLYTAILRRVEGGKLKPVVLRPPFYGMLLFQQAVGGGAILLSKQALGPDSPSHIKVWPLMDTSTGELRVVLINKHPKEAGTHLLRLAADSSGSYQRLAHLTRLVGQGDDPLSATSGITLGGRYYAAGCVQQGAEQVLALDADAGPSQQLAWTIYLPPGSATLVRIHTAAQAAM